MTGRKFLVPHVRADVTKVAGFRSRVDMAVEPILSHRAVEVALWRFSTEVKYCLGCSLNWVRRAHPPGRRGPCRDGSGGAAFWGPLEGNGWSSQ